MTSPVSRDLAHGDVLITGDYYVSAGGPAVLLVLASIRAAIWLDEVLQRVHEFSTPWSITADSRVEVMNVADISIVYNAVGREVDFRKVADNDSPRFLLSLTAHGSHYLRGLIEPFIRGESGHQYLTQGGVDDALVELSMGEHHGQA
jgi:hypothetical protein